MIQVYTDGAYNPVLEQGGWAAVVVKDSRKSVFSGKVKKKATSNRMEIIAALEGIQATPLDSEVVVSTDSQYLFGCVAKGWQRRANRDLWALLDEAVHRRKVRWEWIDQRAGNPFHKEAHDLANSLASEGGSLSPVLSKKPEEGQVLRGSVQQPQQVALLEAVSGQTWRLIDASLNRVGEGLRFLEDIARLWLNDAPLTQQLKSLRHQLTKGDISFHQQLLQSRNAEGDVGIDIEVPDEGKERELPQLLVANARRVQESLRTLEELAKLPSIKPKLDSEKFKQARFNLYTIEQKLLSKLLRQDKIKRISGLYVIIDTASLKGRSHVEVARQVIRGGARVIQLRDKLQSRGELLSLAQELRTLCAEQGVLFIINDYLDIALASDADGLHLGQDDLPISIARKWLPWDKILGGSARTVEQAVQAQAEGADYLAVGAIYPSPTKETAEVVSLERLRQVRQAISLPLVAIGGINRDNVSKVIAAGADSAAVISAVLGAESPEEASRQIASIFEEAK